MAPAPKASGWGADGYCVAITPEGFAPVTTHLSDADAPWNETVTVPLKEHVRYRLELIDIWLTKQGKEANRETLGSSDWLTLTQFTNRSAVMCNQYSISLEVYRGTKHN